MDEAIEAFRAFAQREYERIADTFTNRDEDDYDTAKMIFEHKAGDRGVVVLPGRPPDPEEDWFERNESRKDQYAPRMLYAVTRHPAADGDVYSFYVSLPEKDGRTCNARFRGVLKAGALRLVGRDNYNRVEGWEHRQGTRAASLSAPAETRVLEEPRDPEALDFAH